jgi:hypothetical protein
MQLLKVIFISLLSKDSDQAKLISKNRFLNRERFFLMDHDIQNVFPLKGFVHQLLNIGFLKLKFFPQSSRIHPYEQLMITHRKMIGSAGDGLSHDLFPGGANPDLIQPVTQPVRIYELFDNLLEAVFIGFSHRLPG